MPEIPNTHAAIVMLVTLFALFLFSRDRIPLETSSLTVLAVLIVFFELFPFAVGGESLEPTSLFSGFGHEALIAVAGLMVCGQGLVATGALVPLGRGIARLWRRAPMLSMLLTLFFGALGSAFINNTPIVVLLIPILATVAVRNNDSAAPWLMPMNFSTLLGGTCTTIGTSTNLLVVAVAADLGLREFGMFDFVLPGALAGLIGLVYLWLIAPRLLKPTGNNVKTRVEREFIFQMSVKEDSDIVGKTVADIHEIADGEVDILRLRRARGHSTSSGTIPLPDVALQAGDKITGCAPASIIKELESMLGTALLDSAGHQNMLSDDDADQDENLEIAQIVVMDNSPLLGLSLAQSHFADSYGIDVLAIHRANQSLRSLAKGVTGTNIQSGDILLVQGDSSHIDEVKEVRSLLVLDERQPVPGSGRGWIAILTLIGVVAVAALGILPIASSAVCGALVMLFTRCIDWRDVGDALSIPVIMIVVVSLALGSALTQTGGTEYIAQVFLFALADAKPIVVLSALILLMAILTNVVSNNAAAVIGTPIAFSIATQLNAPPETFVLAVLFGANLSFVTPMAYKTNVLVMSAGDYTFNDFVRVGLPLMLILWVSYTFLLPAIFGL